MMSTLAPSSKGKEVCRDGQLGPGLESLPAEILELIAFYCADNSEQPSSAVSTSDLASAASAAAAASAASEEEEVVSATPPFHLRNLLLTSRRINSFLSSSSSNNRLYARIFRSKFDVAAIARRFGPSAVSGMNLTKELQRRCIILKRIKRAVSFKRLLPGPSDQSRSEMEENLWLAFMMMTENDGLNIIQLQWAQLREYLYLHHSQDMLESVYKPEYPRNTVDRALAFHLNYLLTSPTTLISESQDESDERLFVLRPFVFAAHRFDPFFAPWASRQLPTNADQEKSELENMDQNPFLTYRKASNKSCTIIHCGQEVSICSPNATQAACSLFFLKVERDPAVTALNPFSNLNDLQQTMLGRSREWEEDGTMTDEKSPSQKPSFLKSKHHDRDMKRLLSCQFPHKSPGLKTCFHLGQFEGSWEGRFAYFAFESYRDMLGGKLRSLYEGQFGEQPQVWKIKEHIIKLKQDEVPGGKGNVLNSGYSAEDDEVTNRNSMSLKEARAMLQKRKESHDDWLPEDIDLYPTFQEEGDINRLTIDEDRYEILLSGTGHSAWGKFILRGRVRSWDGMLVMTKEYRPDGRGRWLYRGYVVAGNRLVGRWRDTFTPEHMSGYEGCFLLHRRED